MHFFTLIIFPTQCILISLPHKRKKQLALFYWPAPRYCSLKRHMYFSAILNTAHFPTSHKCNWFLLYAPVSVHIKLPYPLTCLVIIFKLKCVCVLYVSQGKCQETLSSQKSPLDSSNNKNWGGLITVQVFGILPLPVAD